jgi:hypothetical protein
MDHKACWLNAQLPAGKTMFLLPALASLTNLPAAWLINRLADFRNSLDSIHIK